MSQSCKKGHKIRQFIFFCFICSIWLLLGTDAKLWNNQIQNNKKIKLDNYCFVLLQESKSDDQKNIDKYKVQILQSTISYQRRGVLNISIQSNFIRLIIESLLLFSSCIIFISAKNETLIAAMIFYDLQKECHFQFERNQ